MNSTHTSRNLLAKSNTKSTQKRSVSNIESMSARTCARARMTLLSNESNSQMIMIRKMKLLYYNDSDNPLDRAREAQRLFSFLYSIFKSKTTGAVFMYLLDRGATTSWLLQVNLEIMEPTAYQALKRLRAMGLVTPEWRIPKQRYSKGGPRPMVWALLNARQEDVARAVRDHNRALSPNYRVAEELVQYMLEDFMPDGFVFKQILKKANNKFDMSKQRIRDVSVLASIILRERGFKVWN